MSNDRRTRIACWPLALYPRAWRDRYGVEVAVLMSELVSGGDTSTLAAGVNLTAGALAERGRAVAGDRGTVTALLAAVAAAAPVVLAVHAARRFSAGTVPYFDAHTLAWAVLMVVVIGWLLLEFVRFLYVQGNDEARAGATKAHPVLSWLSSMLFLTGINAWLYLAPSVVPGAAIRPGAAAFAVGLLILLAAGCLRAWSMIALGPFFTATIMVSPGQAVVSRGPYRIVRHPADAAKVLACLGVGAMAGNWAGLAAMVLLAVASAAARIRVEESALTAGLGDSYRSYAAGRKRLVPLVW
jgi:protein-S-isoprenylcysteine O-methyltransferase Ste14